MTKEKQDIALKLLNLTFELGKKLLMEKGVFYPFGHYYEDENYQSFVIDHQNNSEQLNQIIINFIKENNIENYVIAIDVIISGNRAIEFTSVIDKVEYESLYVKYTTEGSHFLFTDLSALEDLI